MTAATPASPPPAAATETAPVLAERHGHLGVITLNRPPAMNALTLDMLRTITAQLVAWRADPDVGAVLLRGANRAGKAPAFCAGGDIRFFHNGVVAGDPRVEDFFTEEYMLDHLVHVFPKPTIALMDGVTMGGGMGLAQGTKLRIVTEYSRIAMPETNIGLFPDVGGGWFLAHFCPGHVGEFLALTGHVLGAADTLGVGLADMMAPSARMDELVAAVAAATRPDGAGALAAARTFALEAGAAPLAGELARIDRAFGQACVGAIVAALEREEGDFARTALADLARRSPLMLAVALEQVRRARTLSLAEDLRMERGLMRQAFHLRPGASEAVEGIRALAIDKDHQPRWNPARIADVDPALVAAFFESPWPVAAHPLRDLG
jgi:enoyl-CoA hydratase